MNRGEPITKSRGGHLGLMSNRVGVVVDVDELLSVREI